jgi:hypothetical protein
VVVLSLSSNALAWFKALAKETAVFNRQINWNVGIVRKVDITN